MSFLHLFGASSGMPRFFACLLSLWILLVPQAWAADDVLTYAISGSDYPTARDALIEVIEAEGLVVGSVLPFNQMLQRTGGEGVATPFLKAEIFQFCSAALAWRMVTEDPAQIALCPLSIAIYVTAAEPERVVMVHRSPGGATPARAKAEALLFKLIERAGELAKLRW